MADGVVEIGQLAGSPSEECVFSTLARLSPLKASVRVRLGLIQILLLAALAATSLVAWHAIDDERSAAQALATLSRAQRHHLNADMMHDALRADINAALRVSSEDSAAAGQALASVRANSKQFKTDIDALQDLELPVELERSFVSLEPPSQAYIAAATHLVEAAVRDHEQALTLEPAFGAIFEDLLDLNERTTNLLTEHVEAAERDTLQAAATAKLWIMVTSVTTALVAWIFVALISRSIRRSLRQVSDAARALAAGNLSVRSEIASQDEVGELAGAVNKMADDLQNMIDRLLAEADRDAFSAQLTQALEMAETESDAYGVIDRAMAQISNHLQMELLLSDSNRSDLVRKAEHPTTGAPGCGVESLSHCVAMRRGATAVFEDSDALNSCPRLRNRPGGPMSAVCVPVSFMGRSFGVLHSGGPPRKPPPAQKIAQLTTLGAQAGARIGTVRAFARTELHAYTDGLTGLSNRRALEQELQELAASNSPYAFALADLDNFKRLNDTHGHEAGDKALRLFADVLRKATRQGDTAARWGGEEFAILFHGASARQALEGVERIRAALAEALLVTAGLPFTASFGIGDSSMGASFDEVLRLADGALYRAKDAGRDRALVWEPEPGRGGGTPVVASAPLKAG